MNTNTNKEEIHFIPDGNTECDYCGIRSFEHIHKPNTVPKDFIMVEKQDVSKCCGVKKKFINGLTNGALYKCSNCGKQDVPSPNPLEEDDWQLRLCSQLFWNVLEDSNETACEKFISSEKHLSYNQGVVDGKREVVEKIDLLIQKAEQSYKSAVADQVAPYRHNLENLLELKDTLSNQVGKNK